MKLTPIEGNRQRLDGGAMFGNAPKAVWQRWVDVDENNGVELATRALYVEFDDGLKALFEVGIGAFFEPAMRERFGVTEPGHVLLDNLIAAGIDHEEIDAVVLSHLHFDHAGGLLTAWEEGRESVLLFPNAQYWASEVQWQRALAPHARDRASYIPHLNQCLSESGRLRLVSADEDSILDGRVKVHFSDGHTPGLMLSELACDAGPTVFAADLIPGAPWVHVPITMGYDRFPEQLINEKQQLLDDLFERGGRLFFTHDAQFACGRIQRDERGRYSVEAETV